MTEDLQHSDRLLIEQFPLALRPGSRVRRVLLVDRGPVPLGKDHSPTRVSCSPLARTTTSRPSSKLIRSPTARKSGFASSKAYPLSVSRSSTNSNRELGVVPSTTRRMPRWSHAAWGHLDPIRQKATGPEVKNKLSACL